MKPLTTIIDLTAAELAALHRFAHDRYSTIEDIDLIPKDRDVAKNIARRICLDVQVAEQQGITRSS